MELMKQCKRTLIAIVETGWYIVPIYIYIYIWEIHCSASTIQMVIFTDEKKNHFLEQKYIR